MVKRLPNWEQLTVQDVFDLAPAIAMQYPDSRRQCANASGYHDFTLNFKEEAVDYGLEFCAYAKTVFDVGSNTTVVSQFRSVSNVKFGYVDSDGGESVRLYTKAPNPQKPVFGMRERLAKILPGMQAVFMPFVELHYLGELPNAKQLGERYL